MRFRLVWRSLPGLTAVAVMLSAPAFADETPGAETPPAAAAETTATEKADEPAAEEPSTGETTTGETAAAEPPAEPAVDPADPLGLGVMAAEPLADPLGLGIDSDSEGGQAALDRALAKKLEAKDLKDLGEVVDLLDEALDAGLDVGNTAIAEELLVATLVQRAGSYASAVLQTRNRQPGNDPRWFQVRGLALTDLQRATAIDEGQVNAWLLMGRLQSLPLGNKSEARRALTKVIRLAEKADQDPAIEAPATEVLAQAYALRGAATDDSSNRMSDFDTAVELVPDKAEYLLLRAQEHRNTGDLEASLGDIEKAVELSPEDPRVYELKGLALLMQDRAEEAIEAFDRATELAPNMLKPYQSRGQAYSSLGQTDQAIEQLDKSLELSPNNLESLLIRAQLLSQSEQHERALQDIEAILKQQPAFTMAHLMYVQTLNALDRTDEAVGWLENLVAQNPDRMELQMQLAVLYVDKQMAPEAIETLDRVIEADDNNLLARRLRGDQYLFVGQHENAVGDFERVLASNPLDPGVLNNYAWTLATSPFDTVRDGEKAVELATKACEVTEFDAPHILSTLAAAHAEAGDFEAAIRRAEEAVEKATESGALDEYDGQLGAELASYQAGQPWRELQQRGVSGPADEAAKSLAKPETTEAEKPPVAEPPATEPPPRTIDF